MENPATWTGAEEIVNKVIRQHYADISERPVIGLSLTRKITDALRAAGLLNENKGNGGESSHVG